MISSKFSNIIRNSSRSTFRLLTNNNKTNMYRVMSTQPLNNDTDTKNNNVKNTLKIASFVVCYYIGMRLPLAYYANHPGDLDLMIFDLENKYLLDLSSIKTALALEEPNERFKGLTEQLSKMRIAAFIPSYYIFHRLFIKK